MLFKLLKPAALALALCFSMSSSAGLIFDEVKQKEKISKGDTFSYKHDLNDNGFTLGSALKAVIGIEIWDDSRRDSKERFEFSIENVQTTILKGAQSFASKLGFDALLGLNTDGVLEVSITSKKGDFWIGHSYLAVKTAKASVPEPSSLALLGLGLMGLGYARRKQRAA